MSWPALVGGVTRGQLGLNPEFVVVRFMSVSKRPLRASSDWLRALDRLDKTRQGGAVGLWAVMYKLKARLGHIEE